MKRLLALALLLGSAAPAIALDQANVTRIDTATVRIDWKDAGAVDIYAATDPDATIRTARLIVRNDRDGMETVPADKATRTYFLLKDRKTGQTTRVAERILPLDKGSNFRDLGGYPAAGGKHVKWGHIFRSGAMPLLDEADYAQLQGLKIGSVIDLRSIEEREVAPTLLDDRTGALFIANDYSAKAMFAAMQTRPDGGITLPDNLYGGLGIMLKPQFRAIFARLLADEGAVVYNCSAGQDRTGIASALILTALGVPRDIIMTDYHLSTPTRRPEYEMPPVNPADYPNNPVLQYYAAAMKKPGGVKAEPLYAKDGEAYLTKFFRGIEAQYGSVEAYMDKELGVTPVKVAALRARYLE
ncbi:tyrosine-protein phosphatase [Sphingobium algorifonticola]|uniref:Tyrosine-protein phosphatase n=1 Tax=Sphingobium algorifonticola TaxID=2008318 RepID=A0A437JCD2_9SPHN|nr:tyrosine-protein phosphatase [Sphingobium algorifonticola]RVT43588.1 tyrosine-protein phosphatase [Sphingobium algorifonticola]